MTSPLAGRLNLQLSPAYFSRAVWPCPLRSGLQGQPRSGFCLLREHGKPDAGGSETAAERKEHVKKCDVSEFLDTDGLFVDTAGATKASVGVFVINVEHSRRRQKIQDCNILGKVPSWTFSSR